LRSRKITEKNSQRDGEKSPRAVLVPFVPTVGTAPLNADLQFQLALQETKNLTGGLVARKRFKRASDDSVYQSRHTMGSKVNSEYLQLNNLSIEDNILFENQL
jgi:hypothetical protein